MSLKPRSYHLGDLVWKEVQELIDGGWTRVIIPCGATEAHGSTGLATDTIIPEGMSIELAAKLDALIAPSIAYGVLRTLKAYSGSVSLTPETYTALMIEIGQELARNGFKELIFLNGHAGNRDSLKNASFAIHNSHQVKTLVYDWYFEPDDVTLSIYGGPGGHSGAGETGMVIAIHPDAAPENIWTDDEAGTLNPSISAYPSPFPIMLMAEGEGLPDPDPEKARLFFETVVSTAFDSIKRVTDRWVKLP